MHANLRISQGQAHLTINRDSRMTYPAASRKRRWTESLQWSHDSRMAISGAPLGLRHRGGHLTHTGASHYDTDTRVSAQKVDTRRPNNFHSVSLSRTEGRVSLSEGLRSSWIIRRAARLDRHEHFRRGKAKGAHET